MIENIENFSNWDPSAVGISNGSPRVCKPEAEVAPEKQDSILNESQSVYSCSVWARPDEERDSCSSLKSKVLDLVRFS
jgi:hypothetical protein